MKKRLFYDASPGVLRDVTTHFIVDGRSLSKLAGNHVKVRIINPSGANTDAYITDKGDGTFRVEYTAFEEGNQPPTAPAAPPPAPSGVSLKSTNQRRLDERI